MVRVTQGFPVSQKTDLEDQNEQQIKPPAPGAWHFRDVITGLSYNAGADLLNYARSKEGILSLAQGEGDIPTPDFIIEAATRAMREGKTFYGPVLGQPLLRQEIATYYATQYGLNLPTNRIYVTGSGTTAMHLALTAVLNEGDEVVAVTPIWKNLLGAVEIAQGVIRDVPLEDTGEGWRLDLNRLFSAVNAKTQALLIVSPSNPTGWVMPAADVKRVLDFARERDLWIISDEVYTRTTFDMPRAPSFLDYADPEDKLFVVNSFSKLWAMTGWRMGWLVGPAKAETVVRDIAIYDNMGPCTFAQFGAMAALREGEDFVAQQRSLWRAGRTIALERFKDHKRVRMNVPQSTFYGFLKVEGEPDCAAFARRMIDEYALSLSPGCAYGKSCKGYIRICFGLSEGKLNDALDRFESALK